MTELPHETKRPTFWEHGDMTDYMATLEQENAALRAACGRLLRAYEAEEAEHGFPFNFELRSAHQALKAHLDEEY